MSYVLLFIPKQSVSPDAMKQWFAKREHYTVSDDGDATYDNEATGIAFTFFIFQAPREAGDVAKFVIQVPSPSIVAHEAEPEVAAFAKHFAFDVFDQQVWDGARGPHTRERFLAAFDKHNLHITGIHYVAMRSTPPPALPRETWERAWKWNQQKNDRDDVFIPRIMFGVHENKPVTFCAVADPKASKVPAVDLVITAKDGAQDGMPQRLSPMEMIEIEVFEAARETQRRAEIEKKQVSQAVAAFNDGQYEKTLRLCDGIEGNYKQMMISLRGVCFGELARYDESAKAFAEYFATNPNDPMVINAHAFFVAVNDAAKAKPLYEKAKALLDTAIEESPDESDLWSRRAYSWLGLGNWEEALKDAKKAVTLDENNDLAVRHVGEASFALGKKKDAREWLEKAAAKNQPHAHFYLARVLADAGEMKEAEAALQSAVRKSPNLKKMAEKDPLLAKVL